MSENGKHAGERLRGRLAALGAPYIWRNLDMMQLPTFPSYVVPHFVNALHAKVFETCPAQ